MQGRKISELFQLFELVRFLYLQVEDIMIQHIQGSPNRPREIYMNHDMSHIQNVFVKCHLSSKVGLRSWSQEKRDSEMGPSLRLGKAKTVWTSSPWLIITWRKGAAMRSPEARCEKMDLPPLPCAVLAPDQETDPNESLWVEGQMLPGKL